MQIYIFIAKFAFLFHTLADMKRILTYLLLTVVVASVSGCDFFRQLAGRPTSEDIAVKKAQIELAEARHQARLDSLKAVEKQAADSLAAMEAIRQSGETLVSTGRLGGLISAQLPERYYIMVGAFSNADNADKMSSKVSAAGYEPIRIEYRNGYTAVGICPSSSLPEVYASLQKVRQEKFCPADAWILVNE